MFLPATNFLSISLSRLRSQPRLRWAAVVTLCAGVLVAPFADAFSFDDVALRARQLSALPYKKPVSNLPRELQGITYDQYRDIRFRPEKSYWRNLNLPFELAFFHQGLYYDQPVKINEIANSAVREIRFRPELFNYGANKIDPKRLTGVGFAGFRVHYAINTTKYKDEVLVFLGASYFRALGRNQLYGLSARALAIDTALPSGEEFPRFVEFWIEVPAAGAKELTIYALVDSRRVTGAYRFVVKPGVDTVMDVKAQLYLRENVSILGLAPLTSMYLFGENQPRRSDDYRPEVHDSDGLSIQSGTGEWLWRPLTNPKRLLITSFALTNPLGFGLMQRDRDFGRYEDLEARYDRRPSAWVVPRGKWGAGRVELIQIPTPDETNDNIVAFWVPEISPGLQKPFDVEYRLLWQKDSETRPPLSWVVQTRRGHGYSRDPDPTIGFVVDFEGPALRRLAPDEVVDPVVTADANGEIVERVAQRNEVTGGWRMRVRVKRVDDDKPVELRGFLRSGTNTLSETWSYVLAPE
jgi:periplasmic glucans biosynthesis protein